MKARTGTLGQVVDSLDFDGLEAAGIADARARSGLIEYLAGLGFTAEEMADAERRGRLFGLAGDVLLRSGSESFSLRTAAESIGVTVQDVEYAWSMLGLTVHDADTPILSQADVDSLATWVAMRAHMGSDAADGYMRVLGCIRRPARRGGLVDDPDEHAPAVARPHRRRACHRAGLPGRRRVRPAGGGDDRLDPPPPSGQHANVHRGHHPRAVGRPAVRRWFRRSVRLHGFDPGADAGRVVGPAQRVRRDYRRRGPRRGRAHREVHRRRGDVGQRRSRPAREGSTRSRPPPTSARSRPAGPRRPRVRRDPGLEWRLLRQRRQPRRPAGRVPRSRDRSLSTTSCTSTWRIGPQ